MKRICFAELAFGQVNVQFCCQLHQVRRYFEAHGENHHVKRLFVTSPFRSHTLRRSSLPRWFNGGNPGSNESNPMFFPGLVVIPFEILPVGPHVHEENGAVQIVSGVFLGNDCLLDRVHAADRGAVPVVALIHVPGPDALEPGDLLRFPLIRDLCRCPWTGLWRSGSAQTPWW